MRKQFVVIGMGRVGRALVGTLGELGHEVLALDTDREIIQELSGQYPQVNFVTADATEDAVLQDLGVDRFDGAAIVIGENVHASVLATMILKELGIPLVIARATGRLHGRVLERVGADRVIQPERDAGEILARRLSFPEFIDYVELGDDEAIVELRTPKEWVGSSLIDLQLPRKMGITVFAIKSGKGVSGTIPGPEVVLNEGDVLVVGGSKQSLDRLNA